MILEEAYLAGIDMKHFYSMLLKHFRNLLLVKIAADGISSFDIAPEQAEKLKNQTQNVSRETLQRYLDILLNEADSLRRSQEVRMKIETVLVRMAYLESVLPVGEILATLESLEQRLQKGLPPSRGRFDAEPVAAQQPLEKPQASSTQKSVDQPQQKQNPDPKEVRHAAKPSPGEDLKKFIKRENAPLGAKIEAAEVLGLENGCLTLGIPSGYLFLENIMEKQQKEELERIAGIYYSQKVSLAIKTIEATKTNNSGRSAKANNLNDIKREAMNSPLLQKIIAEFEGAELIDIKPITDKKQGG